LNFYVASGSIAENNVVQNSGFGYEVIHSHVGSSASGSHNKFLGNMAIDNYDGLLLTNQGTEYSGDSGMRDITIEDHLSLSTAAAPNPILRHVWVTPASSVAEVRIAKSSFINTNGYSPSIAWIAERPSGDDNVTGDSLSIRSLLMMTNATATVPAIDFGAVNWSACDVTGSAFVNVGGLPANCATSSLTTASPNPPTPSGAGTCSVGAGACLAYTACNPNLHRSPNASTVLSETIGANLIYRYENGTIRPARLEGGAAVPNWLWDPASPDGTAAFPCGKDVTATMGTFTGVAAPKQRSCRTFPKSDLAINSAQCPHPSAFY
jgi:hypothetical protein